MRSGRWRLRSRIVATHLLVAGVAVVTFLLVGGLLAVDEQPGGSGQSLWPVVAGALVALALSALVALAAGGWLFTTIVTPVRHIAAVARRVARGHYTDRVAPADHSGPQDEDMNRLADAMDELASSLEAAEHRRIMSFGELTHELRTPVAVLEGYLEGLLDGHVKPLPKTWAMLYDEASRVHRLVDELQDLARAEARQAPPELQAVDPSLIAQMALDRLTLHFNEKGLQVVTDIPGGLPLVLADSDQALQALVNLLTNALRYTPVPGQVTLSVGRLPGTQEVVFRVTDTGVGIAAEHIPHLFERFFRVDRSSGRKTGGSGIGLPVAKALVEAMGGRIWAESPGLGKGSTFSFTLLVSSAHEPV